MSLLKNYYGNNIELDVRTICGWHSIYTDYIKATLTFETYGEPSKSIICAK